MANETPRAVPDLRQDLASLSIDRGRPPRRRRRWLLPALALGAVLLAFLGIRARRALDGVAVETVRPTVSATSPAGGGTPVLSASGYVVARRKAVVSAKIQGRLAELRVEEGSRVRRGEILARLESADYQAQVRRAEATVQRAEADLNENRRQLRLSRDLARERVASRDALEAAESRVTITEAELAQARADLDLRRALFQDTLIRAPFDGVVVKKMAEVGESVAPIPPGVNISTSSGAIVALADLDSLEVEADVSESSVARLAPEQPAEVTVEAFPDRRYRAVLRQIIPTADRTKATVQVKVAILDKDEKLKPEMTARVTFVSAGPATGSTPAAPLRSISVPQEALAERDGRPVVFEVLEGRARERVVVVGGAWEGRVTVNDGLTGTETLVVRPPATLRDGDAVRAERRTR
ncbi:MAG TPA: efflux RND transporter periplasmic adaptor subunit [Candidatus Polarisedimenticolia bacterium]|nr:efflux RND transporter periplasmic adaptor subunit [Candidatus Polarisedimenticolia bacterium]